MAVALDTARLALHIIPKAQRQLDRKVGDGGRFHIYRVSVYATILPHDSEIGGQLYPTLDCTIDFDSWTAKQEVLNWQADADDDLGDAAVFHHLHQQAATVPLLSSVISHSDQGNAATTLTGSALSASINARTQGRLLSSFHRQSFRLSCLKLGNYISGHRGVGRDTEMTAFLPPGVRMDLTIELFWMLNDHFIVWAGPTRDDHVVLWQVQVDVVDLSVNWRTFPTSCPGKRRRSAFNPFLQIADSPFVEDTSRGNPFPHARRFNGVRHRLDRRTWVAEMKPPKHKTKQDFGNFKSEAEAARAVDAAFHHYGKPHLLNFPDTSRQFLSTRPTAPAGLDEKAKVKFVKHEAKLLVAATAATSSLHSTHINSLQILELSASPGRCPAGHLRSPSEISSPFSCSGPDEADAAVSSTQQWMDLDSISDVSIAGKHTNFETLNSAQNAEQGWDRSEDLSTLPAPPNIVNLNAYRTESVWLDSLIRSPPAPMYSRSPSPSHF